MDTRRVRVSLALSLVAIAFAATPACARHGQPGRGWRGGPAVDLPVAGGSLEVSLQPDRGGALPFVFDGGNRWVFDGSTGDLVGGSYSIHLANRTGERLKVVVGVDGLNVYEREVVAGRADQDVGSILAPWGERTLAGWQIGDHRAQRFVFSPPEWSEGEGRTDAQIGLVTVQVYREWREQRWEDRERDGSASSETRRQGGAEAPAGAAEDQAAPAEPAAPRSHPAPGAVMPDAPIGTTAGDDVTSSVRTVRFVAATAYPETWALLDYGQRRAAGPWYPPAGVDLLGLRIDGDRDGTRIVGVAPGSPADEAGLRPWDVIVRLDTVTQPSPSATRRILESKRGGDYAFLRVRRGRHEMALKIRG
jgi:hypothetical protein